MNASRRKKESSISHTTTPRGIAEFWDSNSLDDRWNEGRDASFELRAHRRHRVTLDPEVFTRLAKEAQVRGIATETLINLWLAERLETPAEVSLPPNPPSQPTGSARR